MGIDSPLFRGFGERPFNPPLPLRPGLPGGGLVTTRVSDIDFHNGFVRIQSSRTKTRHFRAARVGQTTLQAIKESIRPPGQEWLFPGRTSGHLSTKTLLRTIDRLAEEAGIQEISRRQKLSRRKVTPHILRHSHVVNALMAEGAGADDSEVVGAQEAVHDGDLCFGGHGAGEGSV